MAKAIAITINDSLSKEPFDYSQATVTVAIQLHPEVDGDREVIFSVNSHNGAPLVSCAKLNEVVLPAQITELLDRLKETMSLREEAAKAKAAPKPVTTPKPKPVLTGAVPLDPKGKAQMVAAPDNQPALF